MNTDELIKTLKNKLENVLNNLKYINKKINSDDINTMIENLKNDNKFFVLNNLKKVNDNIEKINNYFGGNYNTINKNGGKNFFLKK